MNPKNPLAAASFTLGTVGLLVLAAASGCGPAPATESPGPDAATGTPWVDAGSAPDTGADPEAAPPLEAGACAAGTADCDGDSRNGCETKLSTDAKNCGACKHDCTGLPHVSGATTCSAGACVVPATSCADGFAHCSGNADDGCEADLSKPATCGACGTSCSGATPVCASGICSNGCGSTAPTLCSGSCVDTSKSATNCASCGHACPIPSHGQATCASSACGFTCNSGYHSCGGGCADNTDAQTCGSSCTPCAAPANGYATCDGTSCGFACNVGFHSCGSVCASDTDATACGAACVVCTVPGGAGHATCGGGTCGISCDAGNHQCGSDCDSNSSVATCGSACTPCAVPPSNGHSTCDGTSCGIACDASYHQCGGNCASNNSVASCGSACTPCAAPPNAVPTCNGVSCGFTCNAGYADCDGIPGNGCEVNLANDSGHCGKCAQDCLGGACSASVCQPLVLASIDAREIAVDATNIYVGTGNNRMWIAPKGATSGTLSPACSVNTAAVNGVTFDVNNVYFTNANNEICWTSKTPGDTPALRNTSLAGTPTGIVTQAGRLFWGDVTNRYIWNEVWTGGGPSVIYTDPPQLAPYPYSFTSDSQSIAWVEYANFTLGTGGNVKIADIAFTNVITIASTQNGPVGVALDAQNIYWTNADEGAVYRAARTGGARTTIATSQPHPLGIAVEGSDVYWANVNAGTIARNGVVIASGQNQAWRLVVDAKAIYWVNRTVGVVRLAKTLP